MSQLVQFNAESAEPAEPNGHGDVELKFELSPDQVDDFLHKCQLRSMTQVPPTTRQLKTVYFDAPNQALRKNGISICLRSEGQRHVQTVEMKGVTSHRSREMRFEIESDRPDVERIASKKVGEILKDTSSGGGLTPLFEIDVKRQVFPLTIEDTDIDVSLDVGVLTVGEGHRLPICEADLELRKGDPARFYELALALHKSSPLRLEALSKVARGYALLSDERRKPVPAQRIALERNATAGHAFATIARACLEQLRGNQPVVNGTDDPEGIHQMRVALRRLRALVSVFRKAMDPQAASFFQRKCRWLHAALGPARDWDVFILETLKPLTASLGDDPALAKLRKNAERFRRNAREDARRTLACPELTEFLIRADAWCSNGGVSAFGSDGAKALDEPALAWAERTLRKRARRLRRAVRDPSRLTPKELHAARISAKKLRYTAEFFQGFYRDKTFSRYIGPLRKIQNVLGVVNDTATSRVLVNALERHMASEGNAAEAARAAGLVLGWKTALAERKLVRFHSVWEEYLQTKPFWKRG